MDMGYAPEHVLTAEIPDEVSPSQNPNFLPDLLSRMTLVPTGPAETLAGGFKGGPKRVGQRSRKGR
jgi:hypothetical protein